MRGLPAWMIGVLVVLAVILLTVGWDERHEAGPVPFIMGIVFALFALGAVGGRLRGEFH